MFTYQCLNPVAAVGLSQFGDQYQKLEEGTPDAYLVRSASMANLAGGILILTVKPFRVGDYIIENSQKQEGTVKAIDIFYTTLTTFDNRKIVIPNKMLTDNTVINVTAEGQRMLDIKVGIGYRDDLIRAKEVLRKTAESIPSVLTGEEIMYNNLVARRCGSAGRATHS